MTAESLLSPPPRRFKPAGAVKSVYHLPTAPQFARPKRARGKRAEGLRYEKKVQAALEDEFGEVYVPGPWFRFQASGERKSRYCQPDGLLFQMLHSTITIVEIKLQHTPDAWWQTRHLYAPVVAAAFPPDKWKYNICEIVRWYDPAVAFPEAHRKVPSPLILRPNEFGVHILRP